MLVLTGCSNVQKADFRPVLDSPEDAHPAPIGWSGLKTRLPTGKDIGTLAYNRSALPGCGLPVTDAHRSLFQDEINKTDLKEGFHDVLESQGYDIVGSLDFEFPEDFEDEEARSEYKVGGRVVDVQMQACYTEPHLGLFTLNQNGYLGEIFIAVEWSLYDALKRSVVYKTRTEGYAQRSHAANPEGLTLMITEAFEMAAHNLGADAGFHDLVFFGAKPVETGLENKTFKDRPRAFDTGETVTIPPQPLSKIPFAQHAETLRRAAVMIQTGSGHGSGFFITPEGHLLTNAHVVGDALRVRVVTADKEQALTAEVLRKNKQQDVALLKLESIPDDFKIITLPVRTQWPGVGEDIFVIGTPFGKRYQDTVMKGIISAHRKNYRFLGTRIDLIQADVTTHPGNSGGPMVDAYGNILGLVHGGSSINGADLALNLFIPIGDALKRLDIGADAPHQSIDISQETGKEPVRIIP